MSTDQPRRYLRVEEAEALDELLDYITYEEERHYDGTAGHIYRSIYVLAKMRGLSAMSPEEIDKECGFEKEEEA